MSKTFYDKNGNSIIIPDGYEEVKTVVVPPDILELKNTLGGILNVDQLIKTNRTSEFRNYEGMIDFHLNRNPKSTVHRIKFKDSSLAVGDTIMIASGVVQVTKFFYNNHWSVHFDWSGTDDFVPLSGVMGVYRQPSPRKPVIGLQGKEMFPGDTVYYVRTSDWRITQFKLVDSRNYNGIRMFKSEELAKEYIAQHKPFYPETLVENLAKRIREFEAPSWLNIGLRLHPLKEALEKLEQYKKENTK
jgi:hypothetical protein